jgi:hypothetical protein
MIILLSCSGNPFGTPIGIQSAKVQRVLVETVNFIMAYINTNPVYFCSLKIVSIAKVI